MNHLATILVIGAFFALNCASPFPKAIQVNDDDGSFEIRDGNCTNASISDLVFHDHVHKSRVPFVVRDATSDWRGDQKIYCLLALSAKDESKGSNIRVTAGGVNHSFVTFEMHSSRGHGLEYDIQVFGK